MGKLKSCGVQPFPVGGQIYLVLSDNKQDSGMINSYTSRVVASNFLEGQVSFSHMRWSNNRSLIALDVQICTRATVGR